MDLNFTLKLFRIIVDLDILFEGDMGFKVILSLLCLGGGGGWIKWKLCSSQHPDWVVYEVNFTLQLLKMIRVTLKFIWVELYFSLNS